MKDIMRFAVSAVIVATVMLLCVSTYDSLQPQDTATYTESAEVQGDISSDTDESAAPAETTVTTTTATTTTATTTTTTTTTTKRKKTTTTTAAQTAATTTTTAATTTTTAGTTTIAETTTTTTTTTTATQNTASMSSAQYATAMFEKVNSYRTENGRSSLSRVTSGALYEAAKQRLSEIMVSFSHTRPDGSKNSTIYSEFGIYPSCCAENLARGGMDGVFDGWINSSGHKANILNGSYTQTAIVCGYANGRRYWVQLFIG